MKSSTEEKTSVADKNSLIGSEVCSDQATIENKQYFTYIFESISVWSWVAHAFPFLIKKYFLEKQKIRNLHYIEASKMGIGLARLTSHIFKVSLEEFQWRLLDIKDENDDLYWFRIFVDGAPDLQNRIKNSAVYQEVNKKISAENRLPEYLFKKILQIDPTAAGSKRLHRLQLLLEVIVSKVNEEEKPVLVLRKTLWFSEIKSVAKSKGIDLIMLEKVNFKILLFEFLKNSALKSYYQRVVYYCRRVRMLSKSINSFFRSDAQNISEDKKLKDSIFSITPGPKLSVEHTGHLNLDSPGLFSDLFFCQASSFPSEDVVLYSQLATNPIDNEKLCEIQKHKVHPVAMHLKAAVTSDVPMFNYSNKGKQVGLVSKETMTEGDSSERKWLNKQIYGYHERCDYWKEFFTQNNIKLSTSWCKSDTEHMAIADALKSIGGVASLYQRSFESLKMPGAMISTDIFFGFSALSAFEGKDMDSVVPYFVINGFWGDHRFEFLKKYSQGIRDSLMKNGAERIVAYFDENSCDNSEWEMGHELTQELHTFILKKVLANPKLGLILKPKVPSTLRRRLGPVAELLSEAEKTGRCYVCEGGVWHGAYPPAVAALSADVAIQGHMAAGTAGVESALTGTPTVMLDKEGCSMTSLYQLERGRVVFREWDELWKALEDHWKTPNGADGFGDWSAILDKLDPFRDGLAAQRMGTYLSWILEGFKSNLSRDTVLADAAERYCNAWGKDKVLSVNC